MVGRVQQWQTRVIRRRDLHARVAVLVFVVSALLLAWTVDLFGRDPVRVFGWIGPLAVWVAAVAFGQKVVVDPTAITVYSMFRVVRVPRSAIARGRVEPDMLRVITSDGRLVTIRAGASWIWESRYGELDRNGDVVSTAARINDAMREIGERPTRARFQMQWRWGVTVIGAFCVAVVVLDALQWGPFQLR